MGLKKKLAKAAKPKQNESVPVATSDNPAPTTKASEQKLVSAFSASQPTEPAHSGAALDKALVLNAAKALLAYIKSQDSKSTQKRNLLTDSAVSDQFVSILITTRKVPGKSSTKPIQIPLMHPIYPKNSSICFFAKDPSTDTEALFEEKEIQVETIMGVRTLKTNYKSFEARRRLCASYDIFLADDRVIPVLPHLLGKEFFHKKKQPVAINVKKGNLRLEIQRALNSTYMFIPNGVNLMIKVGTVKFTETELAENIVAAVTACVAKISKKWKNVQAIHIKTESSAALPIFNLLPVDPASLKELEKKMSVDDVNDMSEERETKKRKSSGKDELKEDAVTKKSKITIAEEQKKEKKPKRGK